MENLHLSQLPKKESTVDYIINTIKNLLLEKKLKPGDMLPSEAALSDALKVSRGSIREAMKILCAFGIVDIRRGDGTYISQSSSRSIIDPFLFKLILSGANANEMAELRELLETQIVSLVIKNAAQEDLFNLERVHLRMREAAGMRLGGTEELVAYDLEFHRALGQATHNVLVEKIYHFTMELFAPYIQKTYDSEENGLKAIALHEGILQAIRERDIPKAMESTQKSIDEWRKIFHEDH